MKGIGLKIDKIGALLASLSFLLALILLWDNGFYTIDEVGYYKSAYWFAEVMKCPTCTDPLYNEPWIKMLSSRGDYITNVGIAFAQRGGIIFFYALIISISKFFSFPLTIGIKLAQIFLFSIMTYFVFRIGTYIFDQKVGLIASLLMLLGTPVLGYTLQLWTHLPSAFFVIAAVFSYIKLDETRKIFWSVCSGFCAASAMMMRFEEVWIFFPLAAISFYGALCKKEWKKTIFMYLSFILSGTIFFVYLYKLYQYNRYFWGSRFSMDFISGIDTLFELEVMAFLGMLLLPIVIAIICYFIMNWIKWENRDIILLIILPLAAVYFSLSLRFDIVPFVNVSNYVGNIYRAYISYESGWDVLDLFLLDVVRYSKASWFGHLITSSLLESTPFLVLVIFGLADFFRKNPKYLAIFISFTLAMIFSIIMISPIQAWAYNIRFFLSFIPLLCIIAAVPIEKMGSFIMKGNFIPPLFGFVSSSVIILLVLSYQGLLRSLMLTLTDAYLQVWSRETINIINLELGIVALISFSVYYFLRRHTQTLRFVAGFAFASLLLAIFGAFLNNVYMNVATPVLAFEYEEQPGFAVIGEEIFHAHHTKRADRMLPILDWVGDILKPVWIEIQRPFDLPSLSGDVFPGKYGGRTPLFVNLLLIFNVSLIILYPIKTIFGRIQKAKR
jgi:hypothetical protein